MGHVDFTVGGSPSKYVWAVVEGRDGSFEVRRGERR